MFPSVSVSSYPHLFLSPVFSLFFCSSSFPPLCFFSLFSPLFLSGFCCSSPLWKGNEAVGHGLRIQLVVHSGDKAARARKNFQTLLQRRLRECSVAVLPLLLLHWEEGAMVEEALMVKMEGSYSGGGYSWAGGLACS